MSGVQEQGLKCPKCEQFEGASEFETRKEKYGLRVSFVVGVTRCRSQHHLVVHGRARLSTSNQNIVKMQSMDRERSRCLDRWAYGATRS
jgi:hypothetical protein